MAADLPSSKGPPVYAPPPPVFSWTGVYIGGQVGYEWGRTTFATVNPVTGVIAGGFPAIDEQGVVGGGHVGYNYQLGGLGLGFGGFLVGIEGDVNGASYTGSELLGVTTLRERTPVDASIRGRVGITFDRFLVYGTDGVAFGSIRESLTTPIFSGSATTGRVGWTVGGGLEYAIDNNWSVRAEYRYTDYGRFNESFATVRLPVTLRYHPTDNRVQVGFSYKFDEAPPPAPPVVAKY
ncbi:MAG TPA: outer membrane beta-barrel protein [Methylovirgula sp.]